MKKYYVILAIVASLIVVTATFLWVNEQPAPTSSNEPTLAHVYHKGDQIPNTLYIFDGFISGPDVEGGIGFSPQPTSSPTIVLSVVFKLNAAGEYANHLPGTHFVFGQEEIFQLNPTGNSTASGLTYYGNTEGNPFYTIVAYNVKVETITMVYGYG